MTAWRLFQYRWMLPLLFVTLTSLLLTYAPFEPRLAGPCDPVHFPCGPVWRVADCILNGPAAANPAFIPNVHIFGKVFEYGRLPIVGLFWFWMGWLIDARRSHRGSRYLDRSSRAVVHGLGLLLSLVVLVVLCGQTTYPHTDSIILWPSILRRWGLWNFVAIGGYSFSIYAEIFWSLGFVLYFGHKLWLLRKPVQDS